jgi:hypothetical protein
MIIRPKIFLKAKILTLISRQKKKGIVERTPFKTFSSELGSPRVYKSQENQINRQWQLDLLC